MFKAIALGLDTLAKIRKGQGEANQAAISIRGNNELIRNESEYQQAQEDSMYAQIDSINEETGMKIDEQSKNVQDVLKKLDMSLEANPSGFRLSGEQNEMAEDLERKTQEDYTDVLTALENRRQKSIAGVTTTSKSNIASSIEKQNQYRRANRSLRKKKNSLFSIAGSLFSGGSS
tara:strand:- start:957 stop:1481 length:525 start_codon:yes stop_codon:yes gene_type:complete